MVMKTGLLLACLLVFSPMGFATNVASENPLQAHGQLVPQEISPQQGTELRIKLQLPEPYRAYSDHFSLKLKGETLFQLGTFKISPLQEFFDENTHTKKMGVIKDAVLTAGLEAPQHFEDETSPLVVLLTYQACTKSYCLFPQTIEVPVEFTPLITDKKIAKTELSWGALFKKPLKELLAESNLVIAFILLFIAGFLTSLTPCIFPMIPITMAVLGKNAHARTKWQNFLVSITYVLGIALTYSLLGVFAASTGVLFGSFMNSPWILGFVCCVFLAMALSMFGLYDIQFLWLENKLGNKQVQGYSGAFFTGSIAGIIAGPCVGPVLIGVLTYVAQTKNLWIGFWSLFIFSLGMGQLFLILGVFSNATKLFPKSGAWMDGIKHFFGLLMLFGFYTYLQYLIPMRWFEGSIGLGAIMLGSLMGAFEHPLTTSWKKIRKGLCQALILVGAALVIVSVFDLKTALSSRTISEKEVFSEQSWKPYSPEAITQAQAQGKPVMLDFFADWCAACKELEQHSFSDPRFKERAKDFVLLRFDATHDSDELEAFKTKYDILGLPTVVLINQKGEWVKDLTITNFEEAPELVHRMDQLFIKN